MPKPTPAPGSEPAPGSTPAPGTTPAPGSSPAAAASGSSGPERRLAPRYALGEPAKVRLSGLPRYQPATVVNLSATGAMLRLCRQAPLRAGQWIEVGLALTSAPVVRQAQMPPARVVRSIAYGDQTDVAVAFSTPQHKLVVAKTQARDLAPAA